MTDLEKVNWCIATVESMLLLDFMTEPVRADLNNIKTRLEEVRDSLSS